jgi:hypothetical protein
VNAKQGVPRLNLAPRLKRPLQLRNPLDYLRLLYWCFFFPQALRWYVESFADFKYRKASGRDLLPAVREDPVQRNLVLQGLLLTVLTLLALAASLQGLGVPFSWAGMTIGVYSLVAFSIGMGQVQGVGAGVASGVAGTVAGGMAVGVAIGTATGVASGVAGGMAVGVAIGMAMGVAMGVGGLFVDGGVAARVGRIGIIGVVVCTAFGAVGGIVGGTMALAFGLASGPAVLLAGGVAGGVASGVAGGVMLYRLLDYAILALPSAWVWSQGEAWRIWHTSRVTFLPLPGVQRQLEDWLAQDWAAGLDNVNELLAYTMQFIPVVRAVNAVLSQLPRERLLAAVAELAHEPFDWNLVFFGFVSLRNMIWNEAVDVLYFVPRRLRRRLQTRFPLGRLLDPPVQAACAGFWFLHAEEPATAADVFAVVRPLPGGEELYLIAVSLAVALEAQDAAAVGQWLEASAGLVKLPKPNLRPAVVFTLRRLREVAAEADLAGHAVSPLMRSTALGRAVASLTQLLADVEATCPQPECAIVKTIAERWRDILARAGGQIAEQVLRQPVENPYEGYSGLPVERTFVGREGVLARLERLWAASPRAPLPSIILYGHRRMGKTSIIQHLYRHRSPETLIARTDMQDLAMADHTGQLLLGFAREIHAAAREAHLDVGPVPDGGDYASTGIARLALNALLERLDPQMDGRRLTLAVDEYEIAEKKIEDGKFAPDFLRYLRGAAQRYRWLGLLFAGRQTLEDELRHYKAVFFGSAEPVRVSFLKREAALHLIRQPSDDFALEYEDALAEELYRLTNGQPYLLQRLCWELVNHWNDRFLREGEETPRVLTLADLEALLTPDFYHDFFLQADYYFSGVWDEAGPDEHRLLLALATREDEQPLPRAELIRAAGLDPDEAETAIEAALRHDLIVEEDAGFRLAVPLMRRWVAQR